ncbi:hypothetical protein CHS0354_018983 [Potamilus streckersoni]|uniref:Uncharacterized protein n=1 Tax=Potamilus streckersoni TaxID=2493646 RepID=A0AAE0SMS6_9BIVA|nr:hypothetical protein CHS0354_018983 [Potamilus streckersoni]
MAAQDKRRERIICHFRQINYQLAVDEEKYEATVSHPGLSADDFDMRTTRPCVWKIMKAIGAARYFAHHAQLDDTGRTFRDYAKLTDGQLTFLVASELVFTPDLYDYNVPKTPLIIKIQGGHIGNSSCNSVATMLSRDNKFLCSNINQVVLIDKDTRRPMPLPDWWKSKYSKSAEGKRPVRFEKEVRPDKTSSFQIRIVWSDTDSNNHTNYASYVRYAIDAAHFISKQGEIDEIKDMLNNGISKLEMLYLGESTEGDVLHIFMWARQSTQNRIIVQMDKEDSTVFQCCMYYFENPLPNEVIS